jgi:hypothetical protein
MISAMQPEMDAIASAARRADIEPTVGDQAGSGRAAIGKETRG